MTNASTHAQPFDEATHFASGDPFCGSSLPCRCNVWPLLLLNLGVPLATITEAIFLTLYIWCGRAVEVPHSQRKPPAPRRSVVASRRPRSGLGVIAALFFAVTIHASIVLVALRFVPFPIMAFRHGYDFSFILLASKVKARSRGLCDICGDLRRDWLSVTCSARSNSGTARQLQS